MDWTKTRTFRVVGLGVAGAVATGAAVCGGAATASTSSPALSQQAVVRSVVGSTEGFQNGTITLRVGAAESVALAGATSSVENRLPIWEIIKRIIKVLGKSLSWLKDQVKKGYSWFVKYVWNKIPAAIRWVISTGWTVYEIFKEIWNYFF
jgi:hypothetical protein